MAKPNYAFQKRQKEIAKKKKKEEKLAQKAGIAENQSPAAEPVADDVDKGPTTGDT